MKNTITFLLFLLTFVTNAQTIFFEDNLENPSASNIGSISRVAPGAFATGGPPNTRYHQRTIGVQAVDISIANSYIGKQGTYIWAMEDVDNFATQSEDQSVTWSGIPINGKTGMGFSGLFATAYTASWDHFPGVSPIDYVIVQYSIDGGTWVDLLRFFPNTPNIGTAALALETTGDELAQGEGPALTNTFTQFSANIAGTGSFLDLRLTIHSNSLNEEFAFDLFRLAETCSPVSTNISSQTNVSCNGGSNGSATINASGGSGFTYSWSPSGGTAATATGLSAGTYTCTVTNSCGNFTTQNVTITQATAITSNISSQTNVFCNGASTGSATVSASGGNPSYTYSWSPSGGTSATATGLSAGTYTCTITDATGCNKTQNVTIIQQTAISSSITSQTNVSCNGASTGSATVSVSGGNPGYTYSWSPSGGTSTTASGLSAGTYTCTITDATGCTKIQNVTITEPAALSTPTAEDQQFFNNGATVANLIATGTNLQWYLTDTGGTALSNSTALIHGTRYFVESTVPGCGASARKEVVVVISTPESAPTAKGLDFDGTNDAISLGNITQLNNTSQYTIEFYAKFQSFGQWSTIFGKRFNNNLDRQAHIQFFDSNGKLGFLINNSYITTNTNLSLNTWNHIAAVYDGSLPEVDRLKLYINGSLAATTLSGTPPTTTTLSNTIATIGSEYNNETPMHNGFTGDVHCAMTMDELRIWSVARTASEIDANKSIELSLPQSNLVSYYKFNQGLANSNNPNETKLVDELNAYNGGLFNFNLAGTTSNWVADNFLNVADNIFTSNLKIYPNPSNGIFNINIDTNATIEIYDLIGKQIASKKIEVGTSQLDMGNYSSGIYLLKVTTENNQSKTMKIIKQ
ncbi:T9SS type A sorting domain-containing protein [Flavobacterium amnicola]|uniref:T9SS type A sorting domain-containing protein n=1 Tax=Flavobacterium amnicola TaxID=2506422 RepID=A0A4Q1K430_9FLAO|nr:LamG-like jellyroll fold domain-containing protein [Flavobacterium amnicola]RXR20586.1 T9SS type A sorting domain-containing protein [Flavobacterium amnicola]